VQMAEATLSWIDKACYSSKLWSGSYSPGKLLAELAGEVSTAMNLKLCSGSVASCVWILDFDSR